MKQLAQYQDGRLELQEVPVPQAAPGGILVQVKASVISPGTEKMKVEQAKMSLLAKAKARPDQVRKVLQTAKTLGWQAAVEKVRNRLESPTPLGYSAAGVVVAVDEQCSRFRVGDRVACGGAECAHHAEFIAVPELLAAAVPDTVKDEDAAYTTLCSISMEAVRQAGVSLGERVLVIGQGLVGLLCTALLKAAGTRVLATDLSSERLKKAAAMGAERVAQAHSDVAAAVMEWTAGMGVDAVILCVGGKDTTLAELSVECLRQRGTLVILGMYDAELSWKQAYMKEVQLRYSRSYGPGRYDAEYEWAGRDYPASHVRWTENRNFQACLELMRSGQLQVSELTTRRVPFANAVSVYQDLLRNDEQIGVVLQYAGEADTIRPAPLPTLASESSPLLLTEAAKGLSVIGAGNFVRTMLLPHLKGALPLHTVVNATALSAAHVQKKFGFGSAATDTKQAWLTDAVLIGTRHSLHAPLILQGLEAGRHLFVEKPLCLTAAELAEIENAVQKSAGSVMVGFNRRFSPAMQKLRIAVQEAVGPVSLTIQVNAGALDPSHWYAREEESGGRLIGEACHFFDIACYLLGQPKNISAKHCDKQGGSDSFAAQMVFENGAMAQLLYSAEGHPTYPKESYRLLTQGAVWESENAMTLKRYGGSGSVGHVAASKGHKEEMLAWLAFLHGKEKHPMSWQSIQWAMALTFAAAQSSREARQVELLLVN